MLLLWATLKPDGPSSNLAAVRFACPVRVQAIRIFPSGAIPFEQQPDIVAETSPDSFYLNVYFNAQQISYDGKTKQKPTNALVQTSIAYQGGAIEFGVGQDRSEHATRLLIIRGKFEKLSLAIYGEAVVEAEASSESYHYRPKQLPSSTVSSIPPALDPGSSIDPTLLAQSLMTLIPEDQRPSLPLIVRLMFCLKPPNEAWDEPGFPHIYANLEQDMFDLNLERAFEMIARPVSDNVEENVLRNFAASLADSITDYNDEEAYFLAKVMARCAPQHTSLLQLILEHIDLARMYTEANLDRWTLIYLTDAAASIDVARQLNNDHTIDILREIMNDPTCEERRRKAASTLLERIRAWDIFEDALINTQASFLDAATFVRDITNEENSFGIWLENMIAHKDILERLCDHGQLRPDPHPLMLWRSNTASRSIISHDDFIRFIRVCIGAASVVAVYAWADSTSIEQCKERTLAVIKFWQNVEGYRQVVNHFMVMRQMIYRLDSMLPMDDDDLPSQAGVDAEYILQTISRDPEAMLRPDLVEVVRKLPMPLNYICDSELSDLKDIASLAKGGLNEALRFLTAHEQLDTKTLMKLRVAIAIILDALKSGGEKDLSEEMWAGGLSSLPPYLIQNLTRLDDSLQHMFGLLPPLTQEQSDSLRTFQACDELLSLMQRLHVARTEPTRDIVALTKALANVVVSSDIAPDLFRHDGEAGAIVLSIRRRCVSILREIIQPASIDAQSVASARAGLVALFTRAKDDIKLNIAHYSAQLFWLIDEVLPDLHMDDWDETQARWVEDWLSQVIPELLTDIGTFFDAQENANKLNLIKHLKRLDIVDTGVADWLVIQEQGRLEKAVGSLSNVDFVQFRITHWQISNSLDFLVSIIEDSSTAQWATTTLMTGRCLDTFVHIFRQLCTSRFNFERLATLAKNINAWNVGDTQLKSLLMHTFLRAICCGFFEHFNSLINVLQGSAQSLFNTDVAVEFGEALEHLASAIGTLKLEKDMPFIVFRVLEQVTPMDRSGGVFVFTSLTKGALHKITSWLDETLQVADQTKLQAMKLRWSVSGKPRDPPVFIPGDYTLDLSLSEWEYVLVPPAPIPSTPKRKSPAQTAEMLGMITVSPPNALLRSPEVKGLTKIYSKNDFRQLRQIAGARQNTSRMPSRHVDDFEQGAPASLSMPGSPTAAFAPQSQRPGPLDLSLPMKPTTFFQ